MKLLLSIALLVSLTTAARADRWQHTAPAGFTAKTEATFIGYSRIQGTSFCLLGLYDPRAMGEDAVEVPAEWKQVVEKGFTATDLRSVPPRLTRGKLREMVRTATLSDGTNTFYGQLHVVRGDKLGGSVFVMADSAASHAKWCAAAASALIDSLALPQATASQPAQATNIVGDWGSGSSANANAGTIRSLYSLRADGTYSYRAEVWGGAMRSDYWYIVEESGTYSIAGDKLTIAPAKSIGTERNRKAITSQKPLPLEKTTYQFQRHYFEGIQQWNLVLTPPAPTTRDRHGIGNNSAFPKSYLYEAGFQPAWQRF